jgi:hypothetical protein
MAKQILNFAFHILNISYPAIGRLLLSLFPIGWLGRLLCAFMMAAGESAVYYLYHESAGQSHMQIHDVACMCCQLSTS